jgi:predicted DNA-binding ribbon-helix-helix protein
VTAPSNGILKRSVTIGGHRTSISLETAFHVELERLASEQGTSISALIAAIDAARDPATNLSSAIRLFVLADLKARLASA